MKMAIKLEQVEYTADDIGCMLFESITKGLYSKPLHAIREYVQNEIEADPPPKKIEVILEGKTLSIIGDGGGMNIKDVEEAKKVGLSFKDPTKHFGFRGIGIWSGVSIADKIVISTKKKGMSEWIILEIDCKGIRIDLEKRAIKPLTQMLTEHVFIGNREGPQEVQGTHVQLIGLLSEVMEYFQEETVRRYMSQVLPVDFDPRFKYRDAVSKKLKRHVSNYNVQYINFNGQSVYRPPHIRNLERPIFGLIKHHDKELAYFWVCLNKERGKISDEDCRAVVYKQWNYTVGNRKSCRPFQDATAHLADWYAGEIHVISTEVVADSTRMLFECTPAFDLLEKLFKKEMKTKVGGARKKSHIETLDERLVEVKNLVKIPSEFNNAREKLKKLAQIESTRDYLVRKQRHKWTPTRKKERIKKAINKLSNAAEKAQEVPMITVTPKKKVVAKKEKKIPKKVNSFNQLTKVFGLTGLTQEVLKVVEEILSTMFSKDTKTLKQIKSAILDALFQRLRDKR